jgi:hypothetical protein
MSLKIIINAEELAKEFKEFAEEAKKDIEQGVKRLAAQAYAKGAELAKQQLKSSRDKFLENFTYEEIAPVVHVVSVLNPALFIEDGLPKDFDMKPGLLKSSKTKTGDNGYKYLNVPFKHNKAPSSMTPAAVDILNRIKGKLKEEKVPYEKLELDANGSPRIGKLHSFNWGGNKPGKGNTGDLQRVTVYQSMTPEGRVRKDIMTFRTVTNNPKSKGANKWHHPGIEGKKFLDQIERWAMNEWDQGIWPEIQRKWDKE